MPISGTSIVFFGTEDFSLAALSTLVDAHYPVALVVTKPDRPYGRGQKLREPAVKAYAHMHDIPVAQPESVSEVDQLVTAIPNRIGVLSSYGKIIPASTLTLFERGIINVHPSLLPEYRGPSPIETAILDDEATTGVSIMRLVERMDAGPVYAQKTVDITRTTTARDLYTLCAQTGSDLLLDILPGIIDGTITPHDQDDADASYTKLLNKKDTFVDPLALSAYDLELRVRAYALYPRTKLNLFGHEVIITRAHIGNPDAALVVECKGGSHLSVDELIAPSGRTMTGAEYIRGYAPRLRE